MAAGAAAARFRLPFIQRARLANEMSARPRKSRNLDAAPRGIKAEEINSNRPD